VADERLQPPLHISPQHHFSHAFMGEEGCSSSDEDPPIQMAQSLPSHLTQCKPCLCQLRPLIADLLWNADVQLGLPFRLLDFHGRRTYMSSAALSRIPNEQETRGPPPSHIALVLSAQRSFSTPFLVAPSVRDPRMTRVRTGSSSNNFQTTESSTTTSRPVALKLCQPPSSFPT
jgi:hypothetical protein